MAPFLPRNFSFPAKPIFFGGNSISLTLATGLSVFVGPNGSGKTDTLNSLKDLLRNTAELNQRRIVYLSSGRSSPVEHYRSSVSGPSHRTTDPAAVGHQAFRTQWWAIEGVSGMFLRLKERPDLLLKIQARISLLHQRSLRLEWSQSGLVVGFSPLTGGDLYFANVEASGLVQLIPLLAAVYDDEICALLIDEPEISMHPQLQAFLLQEMLLFSGDPTDLTKKLIIIATHSPTMLPVRQIGDLVRLKFFTDRKIPPIHISVEADELKSLKLAALIARLTENHKLAFFAQNVLLVEGPSDEIVVSGISLKLGQPLLGSNTQVVPITGKGQFVETAKLFRLMGKDVFVLADLDALADDNSLVNLFREAAHQEANEHGVGSITEMDRAIRGSFNSLVDKAFSAFGDEAANHRYWKMRETGVNDNEIKSKRRAALSTLLTMDENELGSLLNGQLTALRRRYDALLQILDNAGCIILRCGTIEDYYSEDYAASTGKPEAAALQMEVIASWPISSVRAQYDDVVRAIKIAAPLKLVDENALLREQLGSLLGAAMLIVQPGMPNDELNARASAQLGSEALVFRLSNHSVQKPEKKRLIRVAITSKLFARDGFPFEVGDEENLTAVIERKLPSPTTEGSG